MLILRFESTYMAKTKLYLRVLTTNMYNVPLIGWFGASLSGLVKVFSIGYEHDQRLYHKDKKIVHKTGAPVK